MEMDVLATVHRDSQHEHEIAHRFGGVVQGGTLTGEFGSPHPVGRASDVASALTLAHTRLVSASATVIRAMALGFKRPLMGCSPMAVAPPVVSRWL